MDMKFKQLTLGTAAASGILLALSALSISPLPLIAAAQAQTSVSISFGTSSFYDRLQPYGSWVSYEDQYVFLPHHVDHGWRPYSLGHWAYTNRYGWMWVSDERFGWATYHYGRWGYSRNIGWYWVPGRRWAPAWVAWSRGDNDVAWAPLPPQRGGGDVNVSITIGDVPDYYWQAVPTSAFLSINLSNRFIRDRGQVNTIVQQRPPETVTIQNNIVVNNVIPVNDVEKATNTQVKPLTEKPVTNPDQVGKTDPNSVAIFNPEVTADTAAKPKKTVQLDQVITDRKAKGIQPLDTGVDQPVVPGQNLDKNGQPVPPPAAQPPAAEPVPPVKGEPPVLEPVPPLKTEPPVLEPSPKAQAPADGKSSPDAPGANPDKTAVDPLKPADDAAPKVDSQGKVDGKVDTKKAKPVEPANPDSTPAIIPPVKLPAAKAPPVQAPAANVPASKAPLDIPPTKPKDKVLAPPPVQVQKPVTEAPVTKPLNKAVNPPQPPAVQDTAPPVPTGKPPAVPNANDAPPKNDAPKVICDPAKEPCPPAP